jgi:serine/threonine-protein phosphatase 6 regulatory ankyrin repeat subunit B
MEAVRWLLQHQPAALLDARDDLGRSSLILALQNNHLDAAFALLEAGANINLPSNDGTTALTACSDAGMARRLQELTDVNARFEGGMTALLLACKRGDAKMAAMLLDHGADVYDRDDEGMTTLLHACIGGHAAVVELLLKQEPIRLQGNGYECAHGDAEWSEFLYSRRDDGLNALHLAAMGGHAACAQALCGAGGVDVGVPDGNDETALFFADVAVARVLLHAGAENNENDYGHTPVTRACQDPARIEVLRLLLQHFHNSDDPDRPNLHYAAEAGNLEAVRVLLEVRPQGYINIQDSLGYTALRYTSDPDTVRLLLEQGADPRIVDNQGMTPLMAIGGAARARLLMEATPDLVAVRDFKGRTALMNLVCTSKQHEALGALLQHCEDHGIDAEVNYRDVNRDTALHMAMVGSSPPNVKLLLEKGAEVLSSGYQDTTVLMKPFLSGVTRNSTYQHISGYIHGKPDDQKDAIVNECLREVLDAVLLRGGGVGDIGAQADADAAGEAAETGNELPPKRRRLRYE